MVSDGLRKNRGKSTMGCGGELCSSQESSGEALRWIHAKQNKWDMKKSTMFLCIKAAKNLYELESLFKICAVDTVQ